MTRQLLPHDVTAEDRAMGCLWASTFRRPGDEVQKLGVINGAPVINRGVTLDGTNDWIEYGLWGQFDQADPWSFHLVFDNAGFAWDEGGLARTFFDGVASLQWRLTKNATDGLQVWCGGTGFILAVNAVMDPLWVQNGRNVITGAFTTGNNNVWVNGTQVTAANAQAWTPSVITALHVGQRSTGVNRWPGTLGSLKFYGTYLQTALDHAAIWAGGGA